MPRGGEIEESDWLDSIALTDALGRPLSLDKPLSVWLDDDLEDRAAPDGWVHLRTAREVCFALLLGNTEELSLDNDLCGDKEFGQGFEVINFLLEMESRGKNLWPAKGILLHTANPAARERMRSALLRAGLHEDHSQARPRYIK